MSHIPRRSFLKLAGLTLGGLALRPLDGISPLLEQQNLLKLQNAFKQRPLPQFPENEHLGRVFSFINVEVKSRPDYNSETVATLYGDVVVPWLREISGNHPSRFRQRWVETDQGYIWSSDLQPVQNLPNQPVKELPSTSLGPGMWVEVTVPYVDIIFDNPPARSPRLKYLIDSSFPIRMYYSQIIRVDDLKIDEDGQVWYRLNEQFGYGDVFWGPAEAFRPITAEEIAPINPEVTDKRVLVNVYEKFQTLSCYEGNSEVYFAVVSAGPSTPLGKHYIWRKQITTHMSGGTVSTGYDEAGIGWTVLFSGTGVALHSTFWHNNFGGELMSHGCVNLRPEDAKWVFRWTSPEAPLDPGDITIDGMTATPVEVIEA